MKKVFAQCWEESESGWGGRLDGWSFHLTKEDCSKFVKDYNDSLPDEIPDEYSCPLGSCFEAYVSDDVYAEVIKNRSVRVWYNNLSTFETLTRSESIWAGSGLSKD